MKVIEFSSSMMCTDSHLRVSFSYPKFTWISTGDKVRHKKLNNFFVIFIPGKFLKPETIFTFVECLNSRTTFTTVFVVIILVFREVILQGQVTPISVKRHH